MAAKSDSINHNAPYTLAFCAGGNGGLVPAASLSAYAPWQVGGGYCYTLSALE